MVLQTTISRPKNIFTIAQTLRNIYLCFERPENKIKNEIKSGLRRQKPVVDIFMLSVHVAI